MSFVSLGFSGFLRMSLHKAGAGGFEELQANSARGFSP